MSEPKQKFKKVDFFWRFQTQENQIYAGLIQYLNATEQLPHPRTEMLLQAISAFWSPFAVRWMGRSEQDVNAAVSFAIRALELHIVFLKNHFNVVGSNEVPIPEPTVVHKTVTPEVKKDVTPVNDLAPEMEEEATLNYNYEIDYQDTDAIIDSIFK